MNIITEPFAISEMMKIRHLSVMQFFYAHVTKTKILESEMNLYMNKNYRYTLMTSNIPSITSHETP